MDSYARKGEIVSKMASSANCRKIKCKSAQNLKKYRGGGYLKNSKNIENNQKRVKNIEKNIELE